MSEPNQKVQLRIEISLVQPSSNYGMLRLSEEVSIDSGDFQAFAKILSRFHELFEEIKTAKVRP